MVLKYSETELSLLQCLYNETGSYVQTAEKSQLKISPELVRYYVGTKQPKKQRVLLFDIETAPMTVYSWGLFKQNIGINQIKEDWYVLMWAAKWLSDKDIMYDALPKHPGYKCKNDNEDLVVDSLWHLLDEADIVVTQNGNNFDIKKMNAKFVEYGLPKPSHFKSVDTLQIARYNFNFSSNKLDYMAELFGHGNKNKTDFSLWRGCMDGLKSSWKTMIDYCKQDVKLLEDVYTEIKAWDNRHPQLIVGESSCNVCGCSDLEYVKDYNTTASTFEIFQCDKCGHQQRSRKRVDRNEGMVNV